MWPDFVVGTARGLPGATLSPGFPGSGFPGQGFPGGELPGDCAAGAADAATGPASPVNASAMTVPASRKRRASPPARITGNMATSALLMRDNDGSLAQVISSRTVPDRRFPHVRQAR